MSLVYICYNHLVVCYFCEVNKMSLIKKIEIKGLNHKCDVAFDMQEECKIIIGENGVGKTSALKILQYLLTGMMSSVARYVFESIVIIDTEEVFVFSQSDFCVPIEELKAVFIEKCLVLLGNDEREYAESNFVDMISQIKKNELLGKFLDELYYHDTFSTIINRIVEQYFEPSILFNIDLELTCKFPCYKASPVYKSTFYKKLTEHEYPYFTVIFGDMVEKVRLPYRDDNFVHFRFARKGEKVKDLKPIGVDDLKTIIDDYENYTVVMYYDKYNLQKGKRIYSKFDDEEFKDEELESELEYFEIKPANISSHKDSTDKVYDIHSAIRVQYFNFSETINYVNAIALRGIETFFEYIDKTDHITSEEIQELLRRIDKKVLYTHEHYISPILAEELPYKMNMSRMVRRLKGCVVKHPENICKYIKDVLLLRSYMEVHEKLLEEVLYPEHVSDNIRGFQDLIAQYIDDKKICVTPKGLSIYLKEDKEMSYVVNFSELMLSDVPEEVEEIVFGDVDTELPLESLSSGECKIIMLAYYATFFDDSILIMDEPELSISILWQQKLLRDLLDYGQFRSIFVATHSPYIARDPSLSEFIEYLP